MVNPAVWSLLKYGVVEAEGQLVSVEMLATHRKRLRTLASHPFEKWQDAIEGLIHGIPEHDYSTLPANQRPKIAAEEERPFWTATARRGRHRRGLADRLAK
jgi:hypothetical protein